MDTLRLNQTRLNLPNHKLIQQVDMRWNSTYYMVQRYLEQHEAIKTTLCLLDRNDLMVATEHNGTLQDVVKILGPFKSVTKELSSENYTSGSKIIPISRCLQHLLSTQTTTHPLAEHPVTEMRSRFLGMEDNKMLALSTLLDPRFKKLAFADRDAAEKGIRTIVSEASVDVNTSSDPGPASSQTNSTHSTSLEPNLWQVFDEQVTQVAIQRSLGTSAYTELQQCMRSPGQSVHLSGGNTMLMCTQHWFPVHIDTYAL